MKMRFEGAEDVALMNTLIASRSPIDLNGHLFLIGGATIVEDAEHGTAALASTVSMGEANASLAAAAPQAGQMVWSVTGKDETWSFDSLAELLMDHGHWQFDGGQSNQGEAVGDGSIVYCAIKHYADPIGFLPDVHELIVSECQDNASANTPGDWASDYLTGLPKSAEEELQAFAEYWITRWGQPDFFTIRTEEITQHEVTWEEVCEAEKAYHARFNYNPTPYPDPLLVVVDPLDKEIAETARRMEELQARKRAKR